MGSLTKTVKTIRKNKKIKAGKIRKRQMKHGSTPRFPVHLDSAPDCDLPQPAGTDPVEKTA